MGKGNFLFLGTGPSMGIPVIGCTCEVCLSSSSFNKRLRPSLLVRLANKTFLLDAGPDFRLQALRSNIAHIDGVFITHTHFDHIGGLDELRIFYFIQNRKIPCIMSKETFDEICLRYHYLIKPLQDHTSVCAQLDFHILENDFGQSVLEGVSFRYVSFFQSDMKVNGYLFGKMAYISDIREYPDEIIGSLAGVETLVVSAANIEKSRMHFGIQEGIDFARRVGALKTYFTHISHGIDHEKISKTLPEGFYLAYDGLEVEFSL